MSSNMTVEDKIFQWASGEHLTACMPDEIVIGSDEKMYNFIQEHITDEYEYCESKHMLGKICNLAWSAERFFTLIKKEMYDDE